MIARPSAVHAWARCAALAPYGRHACAAHRPHFLTPPVSLVGAEPPFACRGVDPSRALARCARRPRPPVSHACSSVQRDRKSRCSARAAGRRELRRPACGWVHRSACRARPRLLSPPPVSLACVRRSSALACVRCSPSRRRRIRRIGIRRRAPARASHASCNLIHARLHRRR